MPIVNTTQLLAHLRGQTVHVRRIGIADLAKNFATQRIGADVRLIDDGVDDRQVGAAGRAFARPTFALNEIVRRTRFRLPCCVHEVRAGRITEVVKDEKGGHGLHQLADEIARKEILALTKLRPQLARCQWEESGSGGLAKFHRRRKHKSLTVTQVFTVEASSQRREPRWARRRRSAS
jgi:hypothetical protein